jgi:hypothetical protein
MLRGWQGKNQIKISMRISDDFLVILSLGNSIKSGDF